MKKIENEVTTVEERADILEYACDRRTAISLLGNPKLDNSWWWGIPHQPNKIRIAMQIVLDSEKYFGKALLFVRGKLYIYDKEQVLKEGVLWQEDFQCAGLREWFSYGYGLFLSLGEIKYVVQLCVQYKLIPRMSQNKFIAMQVMDALVESNKRNNF